jgi:hypothetical protein
LSTVSPASWPGRVADGGGPGGDPDADPVAIDLNVDAALALQDLAGIDSYPPVLAVLPNVFADADKERVRAAVAGELAEAGILVDGVVHPVVSHWLHCLYRPDTELVVRILDTELRHELAGMLRMSLVRSGRTHVLAVRCDDHIVIQQVAGYTLDDVAATLSAALGPCPPLGFEPVTVTFDQLTELPAEPDGRRRALVELGAVPHAATVLSRAWDQVEREAEVVMIEHRDGEQPRPKVCVSVLDTSPGRVVVIPRVALDGQVRATYTPGGDAAVQEAIRALVDLLPGRDWFGASRSG